jgi:uncharacterized membrane protein
MRSARKDWLIPAGLIALSLVPALAGTARLVSLSGGDVTAQNARFFAAPGPVALHIITAVPFAILGAFQFSPGLRMRGGAWHRVLGRILLPCALLVAISGVWMTFTYPWPAGDGVGVYVERILFGSLMLGSVVMSVDALRRKKYAEHGEWMIRAYAIGLGAGTQALTHLPWFVFVDMTPGETPRAVMMGLGWVINVMVAEWVIRRAGVGARPAQAVGIQTNTCPELYTPISSIGPFRRHAWPRRVV